jgi:hypothetical protein
MSKLTNGKVPSYHLHKQSGQALVTSNGHDATVGRYGSPESSAKYD